MAYITGSTNIEVNVGFGTTSGFGKIKRMTRRPPVVVLPMNRYTSTYLGSPKVFDMSDELEKIIKGCRSAEAIGQ